MNEKIGLAIKTILAQSEGRASADDVAAALEGFTLHELAETQRELTKIDPTKVIIYSRHRCPSCDTALEMHDAFSDHAKWHCPKCGYERGTRA